MDQFVSNPTSLSLLISYEESIGSISKGIHSFNPYFDEDFDDMYAYWPQVLKKPLIYKRTNDDFYPTLHVWYFYDNDSIVKLIKYHWGFANPIVEATDDDIRKQTSREKEYKKKYQREKENLKDILGKPTKEDQKKVTDSYWRMKTIWDLPSKRVVLNVTVDKKVIEFYSPEIKKTIVTPRSKVEIKILMKEK